MKLLREYAETLFLAFVAAMVVRWFVFTPYAITSMGMSPTLRPVDFVLSYNLPYGMRLFGGKLGGRAPLTGEVVVFKCPVQRARACIQRVLGQEGDRIEVRDGKLFVNRKLLVSQGGMKDFGPLIVPPEHVFLFNDDPQIETDSRTLGPIPLQDIEGRIAYIWMSFEWIRGGFWPHVRWDRVFSRVH